MTPNSTVLSGADIYGKPIPSPSILPLSCVMAAQRYELDWKALVTESRLATPHAHSRSPAGRPRRPNPGTRKPCLTGKYAYYLCHHFDGRATLQGCVERLTQ